MHKMLILAAASAALLGANAFAVERGELLASTCLSCHGPDGHSTKVQGAVPSLAGLEKGYLVKSLQEFKAGTRASSVMKRLASGYTDEEYALMADYLSKLK